MFFPLLILHLVINKLPLIFRFADILVFNMMAGLINFVLYHLVSTFLTSLLGKGLEAALNNFTVPSPFPNVIHTYVDNILISSQSFQNNLINLE